MHDVNLFRLKMCCSISFTKKYRDGLIIYCYSCVFARVGGV